MSISWFYEPHVNEGLFELSEASAKHALQVLRLRQGDALVVTNGLGKRFEGIIASATKKSCQVQLQAPHEEGRLVKRKVAIAISPLKNTSRFEWFLEKATELGVAEIVPLLCKRTIPGHFRYDRMLNICISAMLQSQQTWLTVLHQPMTFQTLIEEKEINPSLKQYHQKWIAHCEPLEKHELAKVLQPGMPDGLLLIGPEGDFTPEEITVATGLHYNPVALGNTRLRTETAGIAGATLLCQA